MKDNFHLDIKLSLFADSKFSNTFQNLLFYEYLQLIFFCSTTADLI